jgi:hypothetical protein
MSTPEEDRRKNEFRHEPLDLNKASIRLIEVLPADGSGIVQCRIRHATMEARYACVSYVWGPPDDTHAIHLEGKPFSVRSNIWDFLTTVSTAIECPEQADKGNPTLDFREAAKSLWIDALCIDQDNTGEKNHQVQQMGQIFSSAQHVIAWFNKPGRSTYPLLFREAFKQDRFDYTVIHNLSRFCRDVYWERAWVSDVFVFHQSALINFLLHQITQEVQLARQVLLLAGTEVLDLALLRLPW